MSFAHMRHASSPNLAMYAAENRHHRLAMHVRCEWQVPSLTCIIALSIIEGLSSRLDENPFQATFELLTTHCSRCNGLDWLVQTQPFASINEEAREASSRRNSK
jgi:hypothetical protein